MLTKMFGGAKPDHPFADPKEARRLLEALPAADPLKALEELAHWHESLATAEGFRPDTRIQALFLVDEAAQPRLRKVARDYLTAARPSRFQENRMWTHVCEYWRQAGIAYARSVDAVAQGAKGADAAKPLLPLLVVRDLRALAQQMKWLHLRYGPIDPGQWRTLNAVYAFAESRGIADAKTAIYPGIAGETSPRQELLRALVLMTSSPDSLLPLEVDLVERLIGDFVAGFELANAAAKTSSHWIDLAQAMPPQRLARAPVPSPGLRFFSAGPALAELERMAQRIQTTRQLAGALAELVEPEAGIELLRHLAMHWAPLPPERQHPRHNVKSRLSIVHGLDGVMAALGAGADGEKGEAESWIVENVSAGGFGAVVPQLKSDWLKIGRLIGMQPDGGNNWVVGMIRRVSKISAQEARVGIQTLSRAPELCTFSMRGEPQAGVLLPAPGLGVGETSIALRAGLFTAGQNLESERGGRSYMYLPQAVAERGEDYDLVRFREMVREA